MKRKVEELSVLELPQQSPLFSTLKKQLRSKLPQRRRRFQIFPIFNSFFTNNNNNSFARLTNKELSFECDSSKVSVSKRGFDGEETQESRRVGRVNYSDERINQKALENAEVEVSEHSCVESCSGAGSVDRESKLRRGVETDKEFACVERFTGKIVDAKVKKDENLLKFDRNKFNVDGTEASETLKKSKISNEVSGKNSKIGAEEANRVPHPCELKSNDIVSCNSALSDFQKASEAEFRKIETRDDEGEQSGVERGGILVPVDVACSEHFSNDIVSDNYSSAYSELQSEIFLDSSDFDIDYTPSIWDDSGSQFSENSNESPSPTFQLFLKFSLEFCKLDGGLESSAESSASSAEDDDCHEITLLGLENKEDQECYKMIRNRERRQVYLHDYAENYCSTTDFGDLIIQQRLQMVHWIFEESTKKELQRETMFLGVSLLDRLLGKGYFKTKRNLQIAGIACLTLATRIEENQPFNSVRQKIFHIGSNPYSRCEVVAMEWLVQEVLKFRCFLPTMYNFLWFYLKAARASEKVEKTVKYLSVLALLGHEQLNYWPSTVAAVLVILASIATNQEASCYNLIEAHASMKNDNLPECIKSLAYLVQYIN